MSGPIGPCLHQAVFRWAGGQGGPGMRAVAYSCSDQVAERVFEVAGPALWGIPERPTVVRLVQSPTAVLLLRRVPALDPAGRPSSRTHALIGTETTLDPLGCLGLAGWDWPGAGIELGAVTGPLPELDGVLLGEVAQERLRKLRAEVPEVGGTLERVVADLLRHPRRPLLSVLDRSAGRDVLPLLTGTVDVLLEVLEGPWTFASGADDGVRTRIGFVSERSTSAVVEPDSGFVDPERDLADRPAALARSLVGLYLAADDRFDRLLAGAADVPPGRDRVQRIMAVLDPAAPVVTGARIPAGPSLPEPSPEAEAPPPPASREPGPDRRPGGATRVYPTLTEPQRVALLRRLADVPAGADGPAARDLLVQLDDAALVAGLRSDVPWSVAERLLRELAGRARHRPEPEAERLCGQLLEEGLFVARSGDARTPWAAIARKAFETLVRPYLDRPVARDRTAAFVQRVVAGGGLVLLLRLVRDPGPLPLSEPAWRALVTAVAPAVRPPRRHPAATWIAGSPLRRELLAAAAVLAVLLVILLTVL